MAAASDPHVFSISCAGERGEVGVNWTAAAGSFFKAEPHRSRGEGLLLVRSSMPYSSACNAIAVATAIVVRGIIARRCRVAPLEISPKLIHDLMTRTAELSLDPATRRSLPVLRPELLYARARSYSDEGCRAAVPRTHRERLTPFPHNP